MVGDKEKAEFFFNWCSLNEFDGVYPNANSIDDQLEKYSNVSYCEVVV